MAKVLSENLILQTHQSFKWENNAKNKGHLIYCSYGWCSETKFFFQIIYNNKLSHKVLNINPYLFSGPTIYVHSRNIPLMNFLK